MILGTHTNIESKSIVGGIHDEREEKKYLLKVHEKDVSQVLNIILNIEPKGDNAFLHVQSTTRANFLIRRIGEYFLIDLIDGKNFDEVKFNRIKEIESERQTQEFIEKMMIQVRRRLESKIRAVDVEKREAYARSLVFTSAANEEILNKFAEDDRNKFRVEIAQV